MGPASKGIRKQLQAALDQMPSEGQKLMNLRLGESRSCTQWTENNMQSILTFSCFLLLTAYASAEVRYPNVVFDFCR